jgi:non-haem Fe2+, alpha-ketoglutarate-dependent halogenase
MISAESQVARYQREGVLFPVPVFPREEIADRLARLAAIENARAGRIPPAYSLKPHLLIPWLWDMVCDPRVLAPVQALLGPDVLCLASSFFNKAPHAAEHVPWHQDMTYWGLDRPVALTAWIAFTDSAVENGCLRVLPGSHREALPHRNTYDPDNLLYGREEVAVSVDEGRAVNVLLAPGEMSLHHVMLLHGSEANRSARRRVGFAVRYIPADVAQAKERGSATWVSGRDHGHFDLEPRPEGEFHPAALARHGKMLRRWMRIVGAELEAHRDEREGRTP